MIIKRGVSICCFWFLLIHSSLAQVGFKDEIRFLDHLQNLKFHEEGLFHLKSLQEWNTDPGKRDTINWWSGKFNYELKNLAQSIQAYQKVSDQSFSLFSGATFYSAVQLSYLGLYDSAYHVLNRAGMKDSFYNELKQFQLASVSMLNRDFNSYSAHQKTFSKDFYQIRDYQNDLEKISASIQSRKNKSPFLAGLYSALIPGAGKIYVGKIGQGAMNLLITTIFGLQTLEAYKKDGVKSVRFAIFGSLLTTFYVANIWGSVVSVRMSALEFNDSMNEAILVNMHVPLRVIFD